MSEQDTTHDLSNLFKFHDHVERWTAESENASARLELARIKERMYELRSQHQPLADLVKQTFKGPGCANPGDVRQSIIDSIFYVVIGRWPTKS